MLEIGVFLFGMCICVQLVAALYGIIDLWYTIRTAYLTVIRRILFWVLLCAAIAWLLDDNLRSVFLWGLAGYVGFFILCFWGYQLLFLRNLRLLGINHPFKKDCFKF